MKTLYSIIAGLRPASSILARQVAFPLLLLAAGLVLVQPCAGAPFEFEETGSPVTGRTYHTATLLPNGKVLIAGGEDGSGVLGSAELYHPKTGTCSATGSLATARYFHTATLLPNDKVLVAGGFDRNSHSLATAERYDVGLGFCSLWQPEIATASPRLTFGHRHLVLTGFLFQDLSRASGGNTQDLSSNYPIVQLRSIDSSQIAFLPVGPVRGWSDTSFRSMPVRGFPKGPALGTVFTDGIPSDAKYLVLDKADP